MLKRNHRLLLWWSQQKKDVNDVSLQYDNSQSGHGPQGGAMAGLAPLDPPLPPIEYVLGYRFRNKVQP